MAKDIVCGKQVNENTAFNTTYGDRPYYFCSATCERDFTNNPLKYANPGGAAASTEGSPKMTAGGKKISSNV